MASTAGPTSSGNKISGKLSLVDGNKAWVSLATCQGAQSRQWRHWGKKICLHWEAAVPILRETIWKTKVQRSRRVVCMCFVSVPASRIQSYNSLFRVDMECVTLIEKCWKHIYQRLLWFDSKSKAAIFAVLFFKHENHAGFKYFKHAGLLFKHAALHRCLN